MLLLEFVQVAGLAVASHIDQVLLVVILQLVPVEVNVVSFGRRVVDRAKGLGSFRAQTVVYQVVIVSSLKTGLRIRFGQLRRCERVLLLQVQARVIVS